MQKCKILRIRKKLVGHHSTPVHSKLPYFTHFSPFKHSPEHLPDIKYFPPSNPNLKWHVPYLNISGLSFFFSLADEGDL